MEDEMADPDPGIPIRTGPMESDVRYWAKKQGLHCPDDEPVPACVDAAYLEAHP